MNEFDRVFWRWYAPVYVLFVLFFVFEARADVFDLRYRNADESATDAIEVCFGLLPCFVVEEPCDAGAVCVVRSEFGYGCGEIVLRTRNAAGWSVPARSKFCAVGGTERFDIDGDGQVTTSDFQAFLEAFRRSEP